MSLLVSTFVTSSLVNDPAAFVQAGVFPSVAKVQARIEGDIQGILDARWAGVPDLKIAPAAKTVSPTMIVPPAEVASSTAPLATLASIVESKDKKATMMGYFAGMLGLNDGKESFVTKQIDVTIDGMGHYINTGFKKNAKKPSLIFTTTEGDLLSIYLTDETGKFLKGVTAIKGQAAKYVELNDVRKKYQSEIEFWKKRLLKKPAGLANS